MFTALWHRLPHILPYHSLFQHHELLFTDPEQLYKKIDLEMH